MGMVLIGAGQFVIGSAVAAWGISRLDPLLCVNAAAPRRVKYLRWALTLTGFAAALTSPMTVLMG